MIVLGLDPSLTGFGWCVHNSNVTGPSRVIARGVISTPALEIPVSRYMYLRTQLLHLVSQFPAIEAVGVESPPFGEDYSEGLYALFIYVNEAIYLMRKDVVFFDPQTVKSLTKMDPRILKVSLDKNHMVAAAKAETGIKVWNHNAADAYLIARSAARFWKFQAGIISREDLTPAEVTSFHREHTFVKGPNKGRTKHSGLVFREGTRFFKFSHIPTDSIESELIQWLLKNSTRMLSQGDQTLMQVPRPLPKKG